MAITLTGNPYNLQGGAAPLQGSPGTSLQGGVSPQAVYGPVPSVRQGPVTQLVKPVQPKAVATIAPRTTTVPPHIAGRDTRINSIFAPYIDSRPSASNPGVLEYFNKQTGQGFGSQQDLFNFASQLGAGTVTSFDQLHAPVATAQSNVQGGAQGVQLADPNANFAQYAGTAGLSPEEYMQLVQGQNQLTPEEIAQIRGGLGIDQLENAVFTPPSQTTEQLYNDAYSSAGLADVKQKILDLNSQVNQRRQQFTDAQGNVNENPFLSEASRVGRISRLQDKAEQDIGNLLDQQKQYQDLYQQGLNEVNGLVQRHTNDFTTQQQLNAQKLNYLLSKAEQQAAATLAQKNQAAYSYLPAYLQAKAKATAPNTFSAPNGASFYFDKNTGTFQQLTSPGGDYDVNSVTGDVFSKNTGQVLGSGTNYGAGLSFNTGAQDMRTDRNNNPTAMTTDVAKASGLVEGVDYVQGDPFKGGDGRTYYTAKLLGDPVATTIKAIDHGGFYTQSGQPRWSYLSQIPDAKNWANLSYDQKARVVAQMYQHEGGNGSLVQGNSGNAIDTTAQQLVDGLLSVDQISTRAGFNQILKRADEISLQQKGAHFDPQASTINFKNAQNIRPILNNESSANSHLDTVMQDARALGLGNNRIANQAILDAKLALRNAAAKKYVQAIQDAQAEIAKVLAGNGAVTDDVRKQAEGFLDKYVGPDTLQGLVDQARSLMHQKVVAYTANRDASGNVQGGLQMPSGYPASDPLGLGI